MASSIGPRPSAVRMFDGLSRVCWNWVGLVIENGADLLRELCQSERLLQEVVFDVDHFMIQNGLAGIAGDKEHSGFRAQCIQFVRQLSPAHVGHYDIGDGQMDSRSMILGDR